MSKWTAADVPGQTGRVAVITGANTGLGFETASVLAGKGAHTVLAVRNLDKGNDAVARIKAANPNATVTLQQLDLMSLDNVRKAADELRTAFPRIDLLINNAGVMYTDKGSTKDGFETQFGTNHLGHFALTGLLLDHLPAGRRLARGHRQQRRAPHPRQDPLRRPESRPQLQPRRRLRAVQARQLDVHLRTARRLAAKGAPTIALAAHPGGSDTELHAQHAERRPTGQRVLLAAHRATTRHGCTARPCARPPIPRRRGGQYYGPDGLGETRGHPKVVKSSAQSHDESIQRRLWTVSEELTGVTYPV